MPPDLLEEVKVEVELEPEVKDPLKVGLDFFFFFWGYVLEVIQILIWFGL